MAIRTYVRGALSILTGLWVTTGAAVPIGFALLSLIKARNEGQLEPELLSRPQVILVLLGGYAVAAAIGGWAAGWIMIEKKWRLLILLSLSHLGTWWFALAAGAVPFPGWFALSLGGAAVIGTAVGVGARAFQVGRWSRAPQAG